MSTNEKMKTDVDKSNADASLPKETNNDWFAPPYDSTSIKNSDIINIYRPISVSYTTLENPSHNAKSSKSDEKV